MSPGHDAFFYEVINRNKYSKNILKALNEKNYEKFLQYIHYVCNFKSLTYGDIVMFFHILIQKVPLEMQQKVQLVYVSQIKQLRIEKEERNNISNKRRKYE